MTIKLEAHSLNRYRASAAERRQYGGITTTEFIVTRKDTGEMMTVMGYGKTPGERKTFAMNEARRKWNLLAT